MTSTKYFVGGMNSDDAPTYISDQEYTYALNATLETIDGQTGVLSAEKGNQQIGVLPNGYFIIGSIPTNTNSFIWFAVNEAGDSSIGEFDPNGTNQYVELINTKDLGFSRNNPVQGIFRLRNGCERVIYFTDRVNPFRVINLDQLAEYKDTAGNWDVTRFKLNRTFNLAVLDDITVNNSGGNLRVGAYQFTYRYLDFDGNSTNWAPLSSAYYITDDNSSNIYDRINGSVDIEYYTSEEGGVPATSKSIRLNFTDVDLSYKYLEIGVVKSLEGLGVPTETRVISKKPISKETLTYLYTANVSEETSSDLSAIVTDKEAIETVGTLAHVNSNLYIANTASKQYDWSLFQRAASKITTTLSINQVPAYSAVDGNPKSGMNTLSFVDDEVYALGIVYVMKDGTYSPSFHIPGRKAVTTERNLITVWNNDIEPWAASQTELATTYAQTEDEIETKQVLRRFHVYNQGTTESMGYYESNQLYPEIAGCDGKSIWGTDSTGARLEGSNIRYHKFPDRRTIPLIQQVQNVWYINKLEVEFSNIEYPSTDVQSHFFVQARQSEQDRTVLDQGMMNTTSQVSGKLFSEGFQQYYTYKPEFGVGENRQGGKKADVLAYNSARTISEKRAITHDYVKLLSYYGTPTRVNKTERYATPGFLSGRIEALVSNYQRNTVGFTALSNSRINIKSDEMAIVSPTSFQPAFGNFTSGLYNSLASHSVCFIKPRSNPSVLDINKAPAGLLLSWFVSLKSTRDVYTDLFSLEYIPLQGDWVPVPLDMFQILVTEPTGFLSGGDADATYISHTWMMSPINFALKYSGTSEKKKHFEGNIQIGPDYLINKVATKTENDKYEIKKLEEVEPEFIGINADFAKKNIERLYFPLDIAYDYCNECENTFPNRIYYSKKDNLESLVDNYRIFLANNYRNLDGYGEEIVQLLVDKDELYALCNNYTYYIPTRNQEVKTDASVAYIGTGSELSIPPKRLSSTTYSYGGCDNPLSVVTTEFGTFWADAKGGRVFRLSDSLAEISSLKMTSFFRNNLASDLVTQYKKLTGEDFQYPWQITSQYGVGIICTYDPRYARLILHKKDYTPKLPLAKFADKKGDQFIYTKDSKFYTSKDVEIALTNTQYFTPHSFTLSFNLKTNKWTSFHSYMPEFMLNDHKTFYSIKNGKVYEHNSGINRNYYGAYESFQLETVFNKPFNQNKDYDSVSISGPMLYSNDREGISHIWLYNDVYSTGKMKIKPYTNGFLTLAPDEAAQKMVADKYNIANLRDNSISGTRTRWESTIDLDRSPVAIDFTGSVWNKKPLEGKYIYAKLYAEKEIDQLISFDAIEINQKVTTR